MCILKNFRLKHKFPLKFFKWKFSVYCLKFFNSHHFRIKYSPILVVLPRNRHKSLCWKLKTFPPKTRISHKITKRKFSVSLLKTFSFIVSIANIILCQFNNISIQNKNFPTWTFCFQYAYIVNKPLYLIYLEIYHKIS